MADFDLIAKVKLDTSGLKSQLSSLSSKVGSSVSGSFGVGGSVKDLDKSIVKGNKDSLKVLGKMTALLSGISVGIGVIAKASPKLQNSLERLFKSFLLFLKPAGDALGVLVNQFAKSTRDLQKNRLVAIEELGPEKTAVAQIAGGIGGGIAGGIIGGKAGAIVGGAAGSVVPGLGTGVGAIAGGATGGIIGAGLGYFFGPEIMKGVEDFISDSEKAIGDFVSWAGDTLKPFFDPLIDAGLNAVNWVNDKFVVPIKAGLDDLSSAILDVAGQWASYIYDEFVLPAIDSFNNFVKEVDENILKPFLNWVQSEIIDPLAVAWEGLSNSIMDAWKSASDYINSVYTSTIKPVIDAVSSFVNGVGSSVGSALSSAGDWIRGNLAPPSRQVGGGIPNDGLYYLHRGENVSRSNDSVSGIVFNPSLTVNISGGSDNMSDLVNRAFDELNVKMMDELRRLGQA